MTVFTAIVASPFCLAAQSAATVPASSSAYERLEALAAELPVAGVSVMARPISNRDFRRAVAMLRARYSADSLRLGPRTRSWFRTELDNVESFARPEIDTVRARVVTRVRWRSEVAATNAPWVQLDTFNGLGIIRANTNALAHRRYGWPIVDGETVNVAPTVATQLGGGVAIVAEPIVTFANSRDSSARASLVFNRAYVRGVFHNVALQLGRDEMRWGNSDFGDLFYSGNAAPLPSLVIGSDTAVTLPWIARLAGPVRMVFVLSDLGADQRPRHDKLASLRLSVQPTPRLEIGVVTQSQTGGSGGPPATFWRRVVDFFPPLDVAFESNCYCSNRFSGGDIRLRVPELSGLETYYELDLDDFDARRLRSSFVDDAGHQLGLRLPLTLSNGRLTLGGEWHRTSLRIYEHAQFVSGYTYHERIIGDPIGTHAHALDALAAWESGATSRVALQLSDESRDPSIYAGIATPPRDLDFHFVLVQSLPIRREQRALVSWEHALSTRALTATVGYDRAWQVSTSGRTGMINSWLAQIAISSSLLRMF